jgi:hypothetical protein
MPRTFKDVLADDATNVFLNTDDFAETIRHYIAGVEGTYEDIPAIVNEDEETRDAQGTGDAMQLDTQEGSQVTRFVRLELHSDIEVTESGESLTPCRFRLADTRQCIAIRILGRDTATQTVLCSLIDRRATRKAHK